MIDWQNKGVQPSTEKQTTGYLAGEKIPAGHMNWVISQLSNICNRTNGVFSQTPARVVFGVYTGDGAISQHISLGFRAAAVLNTGENGRGAFGVGGIIIDGYDITDSNMDNVYGRIDDDGFTVHSENNDLGYLYHYIAFAHYTETE